MLRSSPFVRRPRPIKLFEPKVVHSTSALLDSTTVVDNPLHWTDEDTRRLERARGGDRSWERIATFAIVFASFLAILAIVAA